MHADTAAAEPRSGRRGRWLAALPAGFLLLAAAWVLARWPPIRQAESLDELLSSSAGVTILIRGGLPWLLQWAALAVLTVAIARGRFRVNWGAVLLGVLLPLCVGLIWWIGMGAAFWSSNPPEAILESLLRLEASHVGALPPLYVAILGVFGPLTYPLGPTSMQGWEFLGTGLWTALVMSSLTWVARTRQVDASGKAKCTRGQFVLIVVWILLYFGPIYVRASIQMIDALLRLATTQG